MTGINMKQMRTDIRRIESLLWVRDRAQDPEFKKLWTDKLTELLENIKSRPNGVIQ